ncbi:unnamed protein product [Orchesella dallaii]|uniref:G protein-coupled receptor n=1 Tax=Orchesella dallaii TaxID=48710 RepID=A0ABP1S1E4_9HEXA
MDDYPENTILTPNVRLAVQINRGAFFYLYPHLFVHQIDEDANVFRITRTKCNWKLLPFLLSIIIFTTICGLGSALYVCATHFLGIRTGRHQLQLDNLLEIEFLTALGFMEVLALIILATKPLIIQCFNEVFHLERRCFAFVQCNRRNQPTFHKDLIGIFLILVTISLALGGPIGIPIVLFAHGDPFYYIIEEILPDRYNRSMTLIILTPIIRYILCFFCVMEFIRIAVHGIFFGLLSASAIHSLLEKLPKIESNYQSFRIFLQMRVFFAVASGLINSVALIGVIVSHIMTILVLWATIMLHGILHPVISLFFIGMSILFSGLTLVLLRVPALITFKTKVYLKQKRIVYLKLKYHNSIRVRCGSFFEFKYSTVMSYFNHMANNLTNAILLVQP